MTLAILLRAVGDQKQGSRSGEMVQTGTTLPDSNCEQKSGDHFFSMSVLFPNTQGPIQYSETIILISKFEIKPPSLEIQNLRNRSVIPELLNIILHYGQGVLIT